MEVSFKNYIMSLAYQAMIFLGKIMNPVTNQVEENLDQAKLLIDTLSMLKDKTAGNLDTEEQKLIETSLADLQLMYVDIQKAKKQETSS